MDGWTSGVSGNFWRRDTSVLTYLLTYFLSYHC